MSDIQGAKAISMVEDGRIVEDCVSRVFSAKGGRYTVVVRRYGLRDICNCEAGRQGNECYHVLAAHLLMAQQRREATAGEPDRVS